MSHSLFFFNDTATTEIYTLSLHDALPIYRDCSKSSGTKLSPHLRVSTCMRSPSRWQMATGGLSENQQLWFSERPPVDRKSTRLNSSHSQISYAVFCLKKKKYTTWFNCFEY